MVRRLSSGSPPSHAKRAPDLAIGFVLTPNYTWLQVAAFIDALRLAGDEGDRSRRIACNWTVMTEDAAPVVASCGLQIAPCQALQDPGNFDYIAVAGGPLHLARDRHPAITGYLHRAAAQRVPLIGLGTGTFVLAQAGLMDGRRCCVNWYVLNEFKERFPALVPVADQLFLVDGDRITCAGGTGAIDLAAYLIERHCGRAEALKSVRLILAEAPRSPSAPQPPPTFDRNIADRRVKRAILLMEQNLTEPLSVAEIARQVNLSPRQLRRAFHASTGSSVLSFAHRLRVDHARWLLTHSDRPVTAIAQECGFVDSSHLSRTFRQHFRELPSAVRRRSRQNDAATARRGRSAAKRATDLS